MTDNEIYKKKLKFLLITVLDNLEKEKKRNEVQIIKIEKNILETEKLMAYFDNKIINGEKNDK